MRRWPSLAPSTEKSRRVADSPSARARRATCAAGIRNHRRHSPLSLMPLRERETKVPRDHILWVLIAALAASPVAASVRAHPRQAHRYGYVQTARRTASRHAPRGPSVASTSDGVDVAHAYTATPDRAPTGVGFSLASDVVGSVGLHRRPQVRPLAPEPVSGPEPSRFDKPDSALGLSISHPF